MNDEPKSAYEIAMEKLREQDRERGETRPRRLTDAQRKRIAEIRSRHDARLAEAEILFRSNRAKAQEDPEALKRLEEEYARDRRRIEERRDGEIEKVRAGRAT